jgi:hypothetical protein
MAECMVCFSWCCLALRISKYNIDKIMEDWEDEETGLLFKV